MEIKAKYFDDTRYEKVWEQMKLLGIQDVTTNRQHKNGTIVWKLPIKNEWNNGSLIEVASFETGYVRNQNSGYSNYQLNKRYFEDEYYPEREIDENYNYGKLTGKYTKFQTKKCKLIPIEIDRLEYLISYCLKNYYIKHANFVANGEYIPKWRFDNAQSGEDLDNMKKARDYYMEKFEESCVNQHKMLEEQKQYENKRVQAVKDRYKAQLEEFPQDCGYCNYGQVIKDLEERLNLAQEDLSDVLEKRDYYKNKYKKLDDFYKASKAFDDSMYEGRDDRVKELEEKLKEAEKNEFYPYSMEIRVNGQRYKVV